MSNAFYNLPIRPDPAIQAENARAAREYQLRHEDELRALEEAVRDYDRQIGQLEARIAVLNRRRSSLGRMPKDLWLAFAALLILMIGGIVLPLYFLGAPSDVADSWGKWLVIAWFIIGMLLVFAYLGYLLRPGASSTASTKSLPSDAEYENQERKDATLC